MYKVNLIVYGLLTSISIMLLVWVIPAFTPPSVGYGLSPAFMPYGLAGLMLLCSGWLFLKTLILREGQKEASVLNKRNWFFLLVYLPILFITFPLMSWIGFIPAACIILPILQYLGGQRNLLTIVLVTVITAVLSYWGIRYGMQVPLP